MHKTHLPLLKWFLAIFILNVTMQGISANRLKKRLGVSYPTAWYLLHRIRKALKNPLTSIPLREHILTGLIPFGDVVNCNDWQISGHQNEPSVWVALEVGVGDKAENHKGTGVDAGEPVIESEPTRVIMKVIDPSKDCGVELTVGDHVINNESTVFRANNRTCNNSRQITRFIAIVKRWLRIVFRCAVSRHLQLYLDEFAYRFNHWSKSGMLFESVIHEILTSAPLFYRRLIDRGGWERHQISPAFSLKDQKVGITVQL